MSLNAVWCGGSAGGAERVGEGIRMSGQAALVSVIMIFLDAAAFIEEAIASVLAQTYDRWELILVDDGSRDASRGIAERYARAGADRIRIIAHEGRQNRGMSASRNLGLRAARGELVAFLDADDVWFPAKLERQVSLLGTHPTAAFVYGPTEFWYSWTGAPEDAARDCLRVLGIAPETLAEPGRMVPRFLRNEAQTPGTCGVLVRREAALSVGGFEESFRGMFEDQAFFFKLFLRYPAYVTGECLDRYRQHPASQTAVAARAGEYHWRSPSPTQRTFLEWLDAYLRANGIADAGIRRALTRALRPYHHPVLHRLRVAVGRRVGPALRRIRLPH